MTFEVTIIVIYVLIMLIGGFFELRQAIAKRDYFHMLLGGFCFFIGLAGTAGIAYGVTVTTPMLCENLPIECRDKL